MGDFLDLFVSELPPGVTIEAALSALEQSKNEADQKHVLHIRSALAAKQPSPVIPRQPSPVQLSPDPPDLLESSDSESDSDSDDENEKKAEVKILSHNEKTINIHTSTSWSLTISGQKLCIF